MICIEGVIGAGKSSLAKKLAEDLNGLLLLESFEENGFLPQFYQNRKRYAFPLEMSFLADRYHQLKRFKQYNAEKIVISDYYISKSLVFASINLSDDEYNIFKTVYDIMFDSVFKPDILVYLYRPVNQLVKNIVRRGRSYEKSISPEYLENLQNQYLKILDDQKVDLTVLILELDDLDFVKDDNIYNSIIKTLQKPRLKGLYVETV